MNIEMKREFDIDLDDDSSFDDAVAQDESHPHT